MSDHDDDALLETLGAALRATEPVPEAVHRAALDAFDFVDLDAAVASLVDADRLTAVRDTATGPHVFETDDGAAEITIGIGPDGAVLGQLAPAAPGTGTFEFPDGTRTPFTVDDDGAFTGAAFTAGQRFRVRIETARGSITTTWTVFD